VVDVDRLDYLPRDSHYTGIEIPLTKNDVLGLIGSMTIDRHDNLYYPWQSEKVQKLLDSRNTLFRYYRSPENLSVESKLVSFMKKHNLGYADENEFFELTDQTVTSIPGFGEEVF